MEDINLTDWLILIGAASSGYEQISQLHFFGGLVFNLGINRKMGASFDTVATIVVISTAGYFMGKWVYARYV